MERSNSISNVELVKEQIHLQNFCHLDAAQSQMILHWRNHPNVRRWLFNQQPISTEEHQQFLKRLQQDDRRKYWLLCVDGKELGVLNLHQLPTGRMEWGFHLNPHEMGRGIDLMYYALQYFFEVRKIKRIYGFVDYRNTTALLLHDFFALESLGYQWKVFGGMERCFALRAKSANNWDASLSLKDWKKSLLTSKVFMSRQRQLIGRYQSSIAELHSNRP
ncbi:MAG: UDP-4-amino-4,6-dideoxy-N-acetyl-beta-L-altrosamine N-acetyltransferase [Bacteroidota bacterium]